MGERKGYVKIPRNVLDDPRLGYKQIAVLLQLESHAAGWIVRLDKERQALNISEPTLAKILNDLEELGYISRQQARQNGKVVGLHVTVDFSAVLTPKNRGSESANASATDPKKADPRKQGVYKESNKKEGRPNPTEVLDVEVVDREDEWSHENG